jgi:hypothetical protein
VDDFIMVDLPQRCWHAAPPILEQRYSDRNDNNYHSKAPIIQEWQQTGFLKVHPLLAQRAALSGD